MRRTKYLAGILLLVFFCASCGPAAERAKLNPAGSGAPADRVKQSPAENAGAPKPENGPALQEEKKQTEKKDEKNAAKKEDPTGASKSAEKPQASRPQEKTTPAPGQVAADAQAVSTDKGVILNLEDVSLFEFCETVFVELLKRNYQISPALKDQPLKMTVRMTRPVARDKIFNLVSEVLKQYNIVLQEKEDAYFLLPASESGAIDPKFRYGKIYPKVIQETGMIFQIVPLDYVNTTQLDFIIRRYLSKTGTLYPEGNSNSLIIVDYPDRISKILDILEILDRQLFENIVLKIIRPKFWEPSALVKQISELLKIESIPVLRPREQARGVYLFPIERLREVYVFSSKQEWLDRILLHVENLDRPEALGGEERTYIYFPLNTSAADLGKIIAQIYGQPGPAERQTAVPGAPAQAPSAQVAQLQVSRKIIIDESRNSLIFIASPSEWATIQDLLERLDIPAKQVLIECLIGELTLDDQFRMGIEWFIKNSKINIGNKTFSGQGGTESGLGLGSVGFLYTLVASDDLFRAAINAFISQNRIKIVSAPRIVGVDNKESSIKVGTEVPVITSEAVTGQFQQQGNTALLRSIQYRTTGVLLTVKPTIHSGGVVSLDITQEVSEAQTNTISSQIQSPLILNRSIKTSLIAKNGETIFIGGLISKNVSGTTTGVPLLSKIPLLGMLFKSKSSSDRRTELIVLLTPHILSDGTELDYLTDEFRDKMLPDILKSSVKEIKKDATEKK